jgi:hypothetical protein
MQDSSSHFIIISSLTTNGDRSNRARNFFIIYFSFLNKNIPTIAIRFIPQKTCAIYSRLSK